MKNTERFVKIEHFSGILEVFQALLKGSVIHIIRHMI